MQVYDQKVIKFLVRLLSHIFFTFFCFVLFKMLHTRSPVKEKRKKSILLDFQDMSPQASQYCWTAAKASILLSRPSNEQYRAAHLASGYHTGHHMSGSQEATRSEIGVPDQR